MAAGRRAAVLSSVPLQLLLYLGGVYFLFYFLSTLLMIIYKSQVLSFPDGLLALDLSLLLLMAVLEAVRLYCGVRGNLQESELWVGGGLAVALISALLCVYFLLWQAFVLRADIIMSAVQLTVLALQGVLGLAAIASFARWTDGETNTDRWTDITQHRHCGAPPLPAL
ncbi:transmembrane protein 80 isoform X2 [Amia ocellicauda]|uniref:transmembrane protein 80 isoform X2 n=1 Tax=Amia ocellicauda TaxID=2972642 RepID=UPI003464D3B3